MIENHIDKLYVSRRQAQELFGISELSLNQEAKFPNYGIPLPLWFVGDLYNLLTSEEYIKDTDYNCFAYYFNCNMPEPPNLRQITWVRSLDALRELLYEVFALYIKNGNVTKAKIQEVTEDSFKYITKTKKVKLAKLYSGSSSLSSEAIIMREFIGGLCSELTNSLKSSYNTHSDKTDMISSDNFL